MPAAEERATHTPLAPSVEKAYYRKCIQLKRRVNEVEAANDEMKVKRVRLDRAIMKMRLERAFLLDELRKRMDVNVEQSEDSGDETMNTPPPDRPHRDKRRRQQSTQPNAGIVLGHTALNTFHASEYTPQAQRSASTSNAGQATIQMAPGPNGALVAQHSQPDDASYHDHPSGPAAAAIPRGSPYGPPPTGLPSGANGHENGNGEARSEGAGGGGGFAAINN
ncbi:hypothetical protein DOTSEDRAFT_71416 [Dothistroma septosporum NZE10]|uniref:INO80 complex subunit F domain-containing protein n=1 Tax=Dothistroma septosporum (strain NZE10 / CBS 128990) TaxID=675120 RepID=N1PTM2_DOTSN|nr:hypothetical protein DOTSEDRAFT_71416 [Dothistroma septosporum NZE10]